MTSEAWACAGPRAEPAHGKAPRVGCHGDRSWDQTNLGANPDSARYYQSDLGRGLASLGLSFFIWRMDITISHALKDRRRGDTRWADITSWEGPSGLVLSSGILAQCIQRCGP